MHLLALENGRRGGAVSVRVATDTGRSEKGKVWHQRGLRDSGIYDYRAALSGQICFDIGDDLAPGVPRPWASTIRDTHAVWGTLNFLGAPYWGSLTDGKGTHTEVFLGEQRDRRAVASAILNIAAASLGPEAALLDPLRCDPLLINPPDGSRMVREFGAFKNRNTPFGKALWTVGPAAFEPLPATREAAYLRLAERIKAGEDLRVPHKLPIGDPAKSIVELHAFGAESGRCPQGLQCYPGPHRDPLDFNNCCIDCPVMA